MANSKELTPAKRRNLAELTRGLRGIVLFLFLISGVINVLALTGSLYMMQVYDRALTSGSIPTLLVLSSLVIGLYLFQGCFDAIRSQVLVRVGARLDQKVAPLAHRVAIDMPRFGFSTSEALERGRDVDTVRGFLGSQGPAALFDLPWMPIYLIFIYLLHPMLGALTLAGAFVLTVLTVVSEIMTKRLSVSTRKAAMARNTIADSNARSAEVLKAMGFAGRAVKRFNDANREHLELQTKANDITGTFAAVSRVLRMLLQSAVLGLGAYLTIKGELTAGAIIACSVASARALAPVDLAIGNWKPFVAARMAYQRLRDTVVALATADEPMKLPVPVQRLSVEKITVAVPGSGQIILSDVAFAMAGLDGGRLNIGACSLGGAQRCLDESIRYTKERQQFGQPVADFQNTQFTLADMATDLEAARALLYLAAAKVNANAPDKSRFSAMAKRLATDNGSSIVDRALQLHGGYGYLQDYPIERFWRDLRVHSILEGTNQVMRMIVGRELLRQ